MNRGWASIFLNDHLLLSLNYLMNRLLELFETH